MKQDATRGKQEALQALLSAGPEALNVYASALQRMLVVHAVTTKHEELIRHTLVGDAKRVATVFHPDFIAVDSDGNRTTAEQELASLNSGRLKLESNVVEKFEVHPFGRLAVATGVARTKGTYDGKDISGTYSFHQLWAVNSASPFADISRDMSIVMSFNGSFIPDRLGPVS
jgi:hypothetical protein